MLDIIKHPLQSLRQSILAQRVTLGILVLISLCLSLFHGYFFSLLGGFGAIVLYHVMMSYRSFWGYALTIGLLMMPLQVIALIIPHSLLGELIFLCLIISAIAFAPANLFEKRIDVKKLDADLKDLAQMISLTIKNASLIVKIQESNMPGLYEIRLIFYRRRYMESHYPREIYTLLEIFSKTYQDAYLEKRHLGLLKDEYMGKHYSAQTSHDMMKIQKDLHDLAKKHSWGESCLALLQRAEPKVSSKVGTGIKIFI